MPLMNVILDNVPMDDMKQKIFRAQAIETMGFMIDAVIDEKEAFKTSVFEITQRLSQLLKNGLSDDDSQDVAIKDTLAKTAGFL